MLKQVSIKFKEIISHGSHSQVTVQLVLTSMAKIIFEKHIHLKILHHTCKYGQKIKIKIFLKSNGNTKKYLKICGPEAFTEKKE